jgi:hypothetical protein
LTGRVSVAPFEYEYHFIEYEYEYERPFLGYSGNLLGNHWFRSLSYSASRYSYSYSIACIDQRRTPFSKHLRALASRTLTGGGSVAPFEYEYHFVEYEYDEE